MTLPTINNQYTLDTIYLGGPFVQVASKSGIDLNTLDIIYLGEPFWGLTPVAGGVAPTNNAVFFGTNF